MRRREYHIGPGAVSLLLMIVVVGMSVLGLLSLISARGDYRLTERAALLAAAERQTAVEAEETLSRLDAILAECARDCADDEEYFEAVCRVLPDSMSLDGRVVSWEQTAENGRALKCGVELLPPGSAERFVWKSHMYEAASEEIYEDLNFNVWE